MKLEGTGGMRLEDHSWAGDDLIREAEKYTDEIWRNRYAYSAIFFIPLEEFSRDGVYGLHEELYPHLARDPKGYSWQDPWQGPHRPDPGFPEFMEHIRLLAKEPRELLRAAIAYALAHGMDIVPGDSGKNGRSAITGLTRWTLHNDIYDYDP